MTIRMLIPWLLAAAWMSTLQAQEAVSVYDRVELSASAERDIENDLLVAVVFAEAQAERQADAASRINEAIEWAVDREQRVNQVQIQTMQYNTFPVYSNNRRIVRWQARQALRLESEDTEALSDLLGELQERVALESVSFDVSKSLRDAAEEALIEEALQQFNRRAALVAESLGRDGYRIVRINIGTGGRGPTPRPYMAEALVTGAERAAPAMEAGTQAITVLINGTVELNATP